MGELDELVELASPRIKSVKSFNNSNLSEVRSVAEFSCEHLKCF